MTPEELLAAPSSPDAWSDDGLAVARIMLRYREAVAVATEEAIRTLREIGVECPEGLILGPWRPAPSTGRP